MSGIPVSGQGGMQPVIGLTIESFGTLEGQVFGMEIGGSGASINTAGVIALPASPGGGGNITISNNGTIIGTATVLEIAGGNASIGSAGTLVLWPQRTWANATALVLPNTVYTNTFGGEIEILVSGNSVSGSTFLVNGQTIGQGPANIASSLGFVVPPKQTYEIVNLGTLSRVSILSPTIEL